MNFFSYFYDPLPLNMSEKIEHRQASIEPNFHNNYLLEYRRHCHEFNFNPDDLYLYLRKESSQCEEYITLRYVEYSDLISYDLFKKRKKKQTKISKISSNNRKSNNTNPNMIRKQKALFFDFIPKEYYHLKESLENFFDYWYINTQFWVFEAILVCLLFLRDKTKLMTNKEYTAIIHHISMAFQKILDRFLKKSKFSDKHYKIKNHYAQCILRIKVYDDDEKTFDSLSGSDEDTSRVEFFYAVLLRKKVYGVEFANKIKDFQSALIKDLFPKIMKREIYKAKQQDSI